MAVPKRKTSNMRKGTRRAHDALDGVNVMFDKSSGEAKLAHHMSLKDGTYNGKQIFIPNPKLEKNKDVDTENN